MNYYLYLDDLKLIKTYLKILEFTPNIRIVLEED